MTADERAAKYRAVFGSPTGREVLEDLQRFTGFMETSHCPGDPCTTSFREGRRSVYLHILDNCNRREREKA